MGFNPMHMRYEKQYIIYGSIGMFIISVFLVFISYDIIRKTIQSLKQNDNNEHNKTSLTLRLFTYLNIFLLFIYMNSLLLRFIYPFNKSCILISELCFTLFQLTRTIMFLIFIRRIQVIYSDTVFQLKQKYIYILYSAIAIYFIPYISYINWSLLIDSKYDPQFSCSVIYKSSILYFVASILDVFISIFCLYLFTFPLYKLIKHQDDDSIKNQLFNIIIKISILYISSILSSFILTSISFIYSFGFYYGIIDSLINGLLLILLHPIHNTCYKKICCIPHKCCIKCCNTCHTVQQNNINKSHSISASRSSQLKLSRINVLENNNSNNNNIHDIEIQTPVDILVHQGINNMYKKAALEKPAFDLKVPQNQKQNVKIVRLKTAQDNYGNINDMYKNAAFGKPAQIQMKNGLKVMHQSVPTSSPSTKSNQNKKRNINSAKLKTLQNDLNIYKNTTFAKPATIKTGLNVIHQSIPGISPGIQLSNGVQLSPSATVRHALKMNISKRFNAKLKLNPFGISNGSSNPKQSLQNQKSNTLQLINIHSNHL